MEKLILICEDSLDGIFTGVYQGWTGAVRGSFVELRTEEPENLELFSVVREIRADAEQAEKVARSVRRKLGTSVYEDLCLAAASLHPEKGTAVFQTLFKALSGGGCNRKIMEDLGDPYVNLTYRLRIRVWHELHRHFGFVRFREVGGQALFSVITPDNDILAMLGPHFANRFPNENWMIYDSRRQKALLHPKQGACTIRTQVALGQEHFLPAAETEDYEELWRAFCCAVTIQERKNPGLQQQLLPLKYRENMTEFSMTPDFSCKN